MKTRTRLILAGVALLALVLGAIASPEPQSAKPARTVQTTSAIVPTVAVAYWVEDKPDGTRERLEGDPRLAAPGSHSFSDHLPEEDEPAWDCLADGNQTCGPQQ